MAHHPSMRTVRHRAHRCAGHIDTTDSTDSPFRISRPDPSVGLRRTCNVLTQESDPAGTTRARACLIGHFQCLSTEMLQDSLNERRCCHQFQRCPSMDSIDRFCRCDAVHSSACSTPSFLPSFLPSWQYNSQFLIPSINQPVSLSAALPSCSIEFDRLRRSVSTAHRLSHPFVPLSY
jgi:hypothetical protein